MNFSQNISQRLTEVITNELGYSKDEKEIISFSIESLILSFLGFLLIMILGYMFNALMPTITAAIFGVSLRKVSGGAHFDAPMKCLIIGSFTYCFIGFIAKFLVAYVIINQPVLIIILSISLSLVVFLAPVDSKEKPIHSGKFKLKLKLLSIMFFAIPILLIFCINNQLLCTSLVLGVFFQSITLLPIFNERR